MFDPDSVSSNSSIEFHLPKIITALDYQDID